MSILKSILTFWHPVDDEPFDSQYNEAKDFLTIVDPKGEHDGYDVVPSCVGEFGFDPTNPIPVNGPQGEVFYLSRLRSKGGVPFLFHRLGSAESLIEPAHTIDIYEIVDVRASSWGVIFFCPYHSRRSQKVPAGLSRVSWRKMSPVGKIFSKLPSFGVNFSVDNFPVGLSRAVEQLILEQLPPELGPARIAAMAAKNIQEQINMKPGGWNRPIKHLNRLRDLAKSMGMSPEMA